MAQRSTTVVFLFEPAARPLRGAKLHARTRVTLRRLAKFTAILLAFSSLLR